MSESPNPALALLEFERRIQSATSNREVAFRAVNDGSQVLRLRPGGAVALGHLLAAADRRRLRPRRRLRRQPLPAMAGAPGAGDHARRRSRRRSALDRRRAARGGGGRRRGLVPGAPAALPAARPDRRRRSAASCSSAPSRSREAERAARRLDRALDRLRPVGLAQRPPRLQALAQEPRSPGARSASPPRWSSRSPALIPVRLSALAPAEITPLRPIPVTSPLDGVVREIVVKPNQIVKADELLAVLDDTVAAQPPRARHARPLDIARADLQRATFKSFSDEASRLELQVLNARVQEKGAEVAFLRSCSASRSCTRRRAGWRSSPARRTGAAARCRWASASC